MRLLRLTTLYDSYLRVFDAARAERPVESYASERDRLLEDSFGWADFWGHALTPLGWETLEIAMNARAVQEAWVEEHLPPDADLSDASIALHQAKWFRPDLLWYDHHDAALLRAIRSEVPSLKAVVGWSGSAIGGAEAWSQMDLMLTCSPEAAERITGAGLRSEVLQHAFDPRVLTRIGSGSKRWRVSFIGQLLDAEGFHGTRGRLLREVTPYAEITLFVPRARSRWRGALRRVIAGRGLRSPAHDLLRNAKDGVYGLSMYQTLRDSDATLNVHADSSPRFASNMRLFEATGVGACLVTDSKENMASLFEPDREAVVYESAAECVEHLMWLAQHPTDAVEIGLAGQRRTLASHTFAHRAPLLDHYLRSVL